LNLQPIVEFFLTNTALSTSISAKENTLTFNAPLTRSTNTIGIDLSSYYTKSQVDSNISNVQTSLNSLIASTNKVSYFSFVLTNSIDIFRKLFLGGLEQL